MRPGARLGLVGCEERAALCGDLEALGRLVGEHRGDRLGERRGERGLRAGLGDLLLAGDLFLSILRGDLDFLGGATLLMGDLLFLLGRGERVLRLGRGDLVRLLGTSEACLAGDLRLAGLDRLAGDLGLEEDSGLVLSRETEMITGLSPAVAITRLSLSALASPLLGLSLLSLSLAISLSLPLELPSLLSLSLGLLALALLLLGASIGFLFLSSLGDLFLSDSLGDVCLGLIPLGLLVGTFLSVEAGGGLTFFNTALSFLGLSHVMTLSCSL